MKSSTSIRTLNFLVTITI